MADKKISQLTSATTPLAGTEVVPVVQGGSTVKVPVSDFTAGRAVAAGSLTVNGAAVVNESGADADFRVEGDNNINLIFADASTDRVGIGTDTPLATLHVAGNARVQNSGADSQAVIIAPTDSFATAVRWGVSGIRDSGILGFPTGDDALVYRSGGNSFSTGTERFRITVNGNIIAGNQAALATTATNGFLYIPTCAGVPTGTPTAYTGMAPLVVNTTNNKLYFYSGGAWRDAGP